MSQLAAGIRSRGVVNSIRLPIAYAVGNAAAVASRVSGRGSGAVAAPRTLDTGVVAAPSVPGTAPVTPDTTGAPDAKPPAQG